MKTKISLSKLLTLFTTLLLFSNCTKDECQGNTYNLNVNKNYTPYIIPYSDTSTRLFLKNGKDTLLFKSQGLLKGSSQQVSGEEGCDTYNLEWLSLTMVATDTDYFQINYYADKYGTLSNNYKIVSGVKYLYSYPYLSNDYVHYFPTVKKITVLNINYDSIKIITSSYNDSVISKPKLGVIKIKTLNKVYELIK